MMCRVLEVTPAGFYAWLARKKQPLPEQSPRAKRAALGPQVEAVFRAHNGCAGARTIMRDFNDNNVEATIYGVRLLMKELGLFARFRKASRKTTIPDPNAPSRDDLVRRNFEPPVPTTVLCGDITYLNTSQGWMYLAIVMDLSTRMIVGWQIADTMKTQLLIDALDMAHSNGYVAGNAIFHSDRGSQYTSGQFADYAASIDVRLSVGKVGVCWDNAVAESFFSTLKLHLLYEKKSFLTKLEARALVGDWIETYYNRKRIHSTTGAVPARAMKRFLNPENTAAQAVA